MSLLQLQEKTIWRQRAKKYWLKEADMNKFFFDNSASAKKKKKGILKLKRDAISCVEGQVELCNLIDSYFTSLFTASENEV